MKHQNIREKLPLLAITLFVSMLAVSCGSEQNSTTPAQLSPATIYWVTWDSSSAAENMLIQQFQEQYPMVEFKKQTMDNSAARTIIIQTTPPDLLNIDIEYDFYQMIRQSQLADLSELWEESGLKEQVPQSLQRLSERQGKQYYIPFGFGWVGFYYNKQIFANYNLQPPQTWDEFIQICETLLINGETPIAIPGADTWSSYHWFEYLNLRLNGPAFHHALMHGKESFEDARVRNALEIWKSLFDHGYIAEDAQSMGGLNALATLVRAERASMLTRTKAVMTLSDAYNASQLPAPFMSELGFFRFPVLDASLPTAEAVDAFGYVIPAAANNTSQAIAFLAHLSKVESQAIVAQQPLFSSVTYAPVRLDVDPALLRFDQQAALDSLKEADELVPYMWLELPDETWGMMTFRIDQFIRKQEVDVLQAKLEVARQQAIKKGLFVEE